MNRPTPPEPSRRKLLAGARDVAALGAATTLLPAASATPSRAVEGEVVDAVEPPRGYHESEHTRDYYRLARY